MIRWAWTFIEDGDHSRWETRREVPGLTGHHGAWCAWIYPDGRLQRRRYSVATSFPEDYRTFLGRRAHAGPFGGNGYVVCDTLDQAQTWAEADLEKEIAYTAVKLAELEAILAANEADAEAGTIVPWYEQSEAERRGRLRAQVTLLRQSVEAATAEGMTP